VSSENVRGAIKRRLAEMRSSGRYEGRPFALALADLDPEPILGARLGADGGVWAALALGKALQGAVKAEDAVLRLGEARFAVLLPGCRLNVANVRMSQARDRFRKLEFAPGRCGLTFSYGVAEWAGGELGDLEPLAGQLAAAAERRLEKYRSRTAARAV
jgi:GGDEF domain-containing protein